MFKEDYVSFETAKLLKEKGFDEETPVNYFVGDDKHRGCVVGEMIHHRKLEEDVHLIACPTLQMAMKWLREVHKIYIQVEPLVPEYYEKDEYVYRFQYKRLKHIPTYDKMSYIDDIQYITYEKACEAAIKYCLENLI